jgi:hypothetical protein
LRARKGWTAKSTIINEFRQTRLSVGEHIEARASCRLEDSQKVVETVVEKLLVVAEKLVLRN